MWHAKERRGNIDLGFIEKTGGMTMLGRSAKNGGGGDSGATEL
jgi:hypothetical protein